MLYSGTYIIAYLIHWTYMFTEGLSPLFLQATLLSEQLAPVSPSILHQKPMPSATSIDRELIFIRDGNL